MAPLRSTTGRPHHQPRSAASTLRAQTRGHKHTTSITVMDAIPKNAVGKTDKAPLRAAHLKGTSV
jgi:long-chain acyl-CoA synthetase